MEKIITNSEAETFAFAKKFASGLSFGDVICLSGDLGVGKTIFTKGICDFFGVADIVNSPTFTLVNEYLADSGETIYHFDMYRIDDEDELVEIGFDDYINSGALTIIEWPEKIPYSLPKKRIAISIMRSDEGSDDTRIITVEEHI